MTVDAHTLDKARALLKRVANQILAALEEMKDPAHVPQCNASAFEGFDDPMLICSCPACIRRNAAKARVPDNRKGSKE